VSLAGLARQELHLVGGRRRRDDYSGRLTPAEERVAALLSTGASNREIAARLVVSEATVKTHVEHIFAKLGVHSRREVIARFPATDQRPDHPPPLSDPGALRLNLPETVPAAAMAPVAERLLYGLGRP
jgi:DNA-binding CsgD family transcriptional regulator